MPEPEPRSQTDRDPSADDDLEERQVRSELAGRLFGEPNEPVKIGRYVVIKPVGQGGLGVVYAAFDPDLDRKIAVKLVRPDRRAGKRAEAIQSRMVREAQAMARLSHQNVIHVYDVGTFEDQVFIAMEFVEGRSLREWIDEGPHSIPEVLDVMRQAGLGLAAAHGGGVVHRDFKPDNVLVSDAGRVYVVDFGIARALQAPGEVDVTLEPADPSSRSASNLATPLTQTGELVGTPAYMSAEQFRRLPTDARTDQFSFCVTLYEALYGERPFAGSKVAEVARAVESGTIQNAPAGARVPQWLRRTIVKGLAETPADRYPDMADLLEALDRDPVRARKRVIGATVAVGLAGLAVWGIASSEAGLCQGAGDKLVGTWDDARRRAVETAFTNTDLVYAASSNERVARVLDDYADAWVAMHTEACEATHVSGEQSAALLDRRMTCLGHRLDSLRATALVLAAADAVVVEHAIEAASALPALDGCADADALLAEVDPPADGQTRARVADVRSRTAQASAERAAGRYATALALMQPLLAEADAIAYRPLQAEVREYLAACTAFAGDPPGAEPLLREALWHAEAAGHDRVVFGALVGLIDLLGHDLHRPDEAQAFAERGWAVLQRTGGSPPFEARLRNVIGIMHQDSGRSDEAMAQMQRVLEIREGILGPDHLMVGRALNNLSLFAERRGEYEDAYEYGKRALAIKEKNLGADHPDTAMSLSLLANAEQRLGRNEDSIAHQLEALRRREAALGPDHEGTVMHHVSLGNVYQRVNQPEKAIEHSLRAMAILEATFGANDPKLIPPLANLGLAYRWVDRDDDALAVFRRAVAIAESELDPSHPMVANTLLNLANLELARGHVERALARYHRGLVITDATYGPDHPRSELLLNGVGMAHNGAERYDQAIAPLERALALRERREAQVVPGKMAYTRYQLAIALWGANHNRRRARALAERALEGFKQSGPQGEELLAEVEAWLREHPL